MASRSVAIRTDHSMMDEINSTKINYHLIPNIMVGLSKKMMLHGNVFFSNRTEKFKWEGGSLYAKYRFLSHDKMQEHFRMAIYGTLSFNNSDIHQEEINMYGHNTGFDGGVVATQLLHKIALSSCLSFTKALDNGNNKFNYGVPNSKAVNYSFSFGKLMLPKEYEGYRQLNLNLMTETLTQFNTGSGKYYVDVSAIVQLIFNSESRIDLGYKREVSGNLIRTAPNGFFVRVEHNFFNVF